MFRAMYVFNFFARNLLGLLLGIFIGGIFDHQIKETLASLVQIWL
jgi:hypothetical protein